MYFDSRSRDLRFRKLEAGDVVEIEYRLFPAADVNPWAGYYARLDLLHPSCSVRLWRRVVIAPSTMKLYVVERGLQPAVVRQDGAETTRIWQLGELAVPREEPSLVPGASGSYLHVSTIGSLQEFGRWYTQLLEPELKLDDNLRTMAEKILERKLSTPEKVQAVYESVRRGTKYMGFEFGVHRYQPYPVSMVVRRGFGDCKDKAAMMVALLRAVGVQAEFALVRTRAAGTIPAGAYSVQLFDHAMVFVPELNLYLDGTAESAVLGELPPKDRGAVAVTVNEEGKATLRTVPFARPRAIPETEARIPRDGGAEIASQTKAEGYFAANQH